MGRFVNVECLKHLASLITDDARCTGQIKSKVAMTKSAFNKKNLLTSGLGLTLRKTVMQFYV